MRQVAKAARPLTNSCTKSALVTMVACGHRHGGTVGQCSTDAGAGSTVEQAANAVRQASIAPSLVSFIV